LPAAWPPLAHQPARNMSIRERKYIDMRTVVYVLSVIMIP
jgi:hypothetical protein